MLMKKGSLFYFPFIAIPILFSPNSKAQREYFKNPHVVYKVDKEDENYIVNYTFKDQFDNLQNFELTMPADFTDNEIAVFGVPSWLLQPYTDTEYNRKIRDQELKKGLFELIGNTIEADKNAVIKRYSESFCKPIARLIIQSLEEYGRDTRRDRIEMAIRLVQDIPYGIPIFKDKDRHYGGVIPPPAVLKKGYGDCDSKVLLFAGILIHLIPGNEIIFLNQPDHVLSAIAAEKEENLTYVEFRNKTYLVAETAGPGRRKLGEKGNYFRNKFTAEPLSLDLPEPLPYNPDAVAVRLVPDKIQVEKNKVIIKNTSANYFRFQLSFDKVNWKEFNLHMNESGIFNLADQDVVYLRIHRSKGYDTFEIQPGNSYPFRWNSKAGKWEPDIGSL
jgi:hypothetical protein